MWFLGHEGGNLGNVCSLLAVFLYLNIKSANKKLSYTKVTHSQQLSYKARFDKLRNVDIPWDSVYSSKTWQDSKSLSFEEESLNFLTHDPFLLYPLLNCLFDLPDQVTSCDFVKLIRFVSQLQC